MSRPVPAADLAIGIDIGGSKTAIGIVDRRSGAVIERRIVPTPPLPQTGRSFARKLAGQAAELRDGVAGSDIAAVGIGICELVDRTGEIVSAHRVRLDRPQVADAFAGFDEIAINSDVSAAATAEARFGHGRGLGHWIYVNAGTGVACVLMNGEHCHFGEHGWVYSLGMSAADLTAREHAASPLIEEISGGSGLLAAARAARDDVASVGELIKKANAGYALAHDILARGGRVLGGAIGMLVNALDPAAVIVGGGLVSSQSPYWDALVDAVRAQIWHPAAKGIDIRRAALSADAGLIGAAVIGFRP